MMMLFGSALTIDFLFVFVCILRENSNRYTASRQLICYVWKATIITEEPTISSYDMFLSAIHRNSLLISTNAALGTCACSKRSLKLITAFRIIISWTYFFMCLHSRSLIDPRTIRKDAKDVWQNGDAGRRAAEL